MKNKRAKGRYGYRDYRRKLLTAQVLLGAFLIAAQLFARNFTDSQAAQNVLTLMAILTVLPTANAASPLIASWRYKTPGAPFYEVVRRYEDRALLLYDLTLTSKAFILPADAAAIHPQGVFLCCPRQKAVAAEAERFLTDAFSGSGVGLPVKVIQEEKAFCRRLDGLKPPGEAPDWEKTAARAESLLKSLSM